jgi:hypothetical protein
VKLILAQPSILRFQWELEVLLTNLRQLTDMEVVLLFSKPHDYNDTVPRYLVNKYSGVQCFVYDDNRYLKTYIPSIRPYLWWQYLSKDPAREQETYFYIDSDVIFREFPNVAQLPADAKHWFGSSCESYIAYDYIKQCQNGEAILQAMAQICGITVDQMQGVPGIGAHLLISQPTAEFWHRAFEDSVALYRHLDGVDSNIQKWTAEMWAQLWGMVREGITLSAPSELDFCMSTDPIKRWNEVKILHNAGVVSSGAMFFKGNYVDKTPFGENFNYVDTKKCSRIYVDAIEKVIV